MCLSPGSDSVARSCFQVSTEERSSPLPVLGRATTARTSGVDDGAGASQLSVTCPAPYSMLHIVILPSPFPHIAQLQTSDSTFRFLYSRQPGHFQLSACKALFQPPKRAYLPNPQTNTHPTKRPALDPAKHSKGSRVTYTVDKATDHYTDIET